MPFSPFTQDYLCSVRIFSVKKNSIVHRRRCDNLIWKHASVASRKQLLKFWVRNWGQAKPFTRLTFLARDFGPGFPIMKYVLGHKTGSHFKTSDEPSTPDHGVYRSGHQDSVFQEAGGLCFQKDGHVSS